MNIPCFTKIALLGIALFLWGKVPPPLFSQKLQSKKESSLALDLLDITEIQQKEARQFVRDLASVEFSVRERAQQGLKAIGPGVLPILKEGLSTSDREVRFRLEQIQHSLGEEYFNVALLRFRQNKELPPGFEIPGWTKFQEIAGSSEGSRSLYADLVDEKPELLKRAFSDSEKLGPLLTEALTQAQAWQYVDASQPQEVVLTLLFLDCCLEGELPLQSANQLQYFCNQPVMRKLFTETRKNEKDRTPRATVVKKLFAHWLSKPAPPLCRHYRAVLAEQNGFHEAAVLHTVAFLENGTQQSIPQLVRAFRILVQYSDLKKQGQLMSKFLTDKRVCSSGVSRDNRKYNLSIQVRDLALATLIVIHDQDFKEYGFLPLEKGEKFGDHLFLQKYGFEKNEQRVIALEKWKVFAESQTKNGIDKEGL
ncbi:MAG: hypothetical protein MPJ24_11275 [Pirellulaceae bacterium]|nr:hypothetical protein [Pirellulaceae bacterium]